MCKCKGSLLSLFLKYPRFQLFVVVSPYFLCSSLLQCQFNFLSVIFSIRSSYINESGIKGLYISRAVFPVTCELVCCRLCAVFKWSFEAEIQEMWGGVTARSLISVWSVETFGAGCWLLHTKLRLDTHTYTILVRKYSEFLHNRHKSSLFHCAHYRSQVCNWHTRFPNYFTDCPGDTSVQTGRQ